MARGFTTSLSTESSDASQRNRGQCCAHRPLHGRGTARDFGDCFRTLSCANCDRLKKHITETTPVVLVMNGSFWSTNIPRHWYLPLTRCLNFRFI